MTDDKPLPERIRAKAAELGFAACGFAPADAAPRAGERLRQWLADGCHGDMIWMEERAHHRESPRGLWPEVRTVIALGMSYAPARDPLALADAGGVGRISAYAQGADYHDVVKKALKALGRWLAREAGCDLKVFVDTAPVMEKPLSEAAGLGWQGKHTNLVSREHGSWLFLGAIYTTLDLAGDAPGRDRCGSCDACQRACPTDAFPAPYRLDARRCISYWTIEHAGPIPEAFRPAIGNRIYGCDDCLAVCPWNKFAEMAAANRAFRPRAELAAPALADLLALDDAAFRQVFAGSPIKRIGRDRMVRNCLIAAGNSGDPALLSAASALLSDESLVVRDAAAWACNRLAGSDGGGGRSDGGRRSGMADTPQAGGQDGRKGAADGTNEQGGHGAGGESGGGAYANPHEGAKGGESGFMGHGGQSEIEHHGGGKANATTGSDKGDSGAQDGDRPERNLRSERLGDHVVTIEEDGDAHAQATGNVDSPNRPG